MLPSVLIHAHPERMQANIDRTHGLVFSQRVLLALVDKGLVRQQAYGLVQRNAMLSWEEGLDFKALLLDDGAVRQHLTADELDRFNEHLLDAVNATGEVFLSHTRLNSRFTLRLAVGHLRTKESHVTRAWELLKTHASRLATTRQPT